MLIENDPAAEPENAAGSTGEAEKAAVPLAEEETAESPEGDEPAEEGAEKAEEPAEREEYEIFLEGEEPEPVPKDDKAFARMRLAEKEARAEAARLKRELEALRAPAGVPDPGEEPTIEACDYDQDELKRRLRKWDQDKAAFDAHKAKAAEQEQAQHREAQSRINAYVQAGEELSRRVPGYVDAEKVVAAGMSEDRKFTLLKYADNPARVVYFLGRNPERLEEFAKENDLGRFVAKLAKLEVSMKERKKTQAPPPDQSPRGSGAVNSADSTLEKLRARAEKTGDYGPVNAYKRKQRAKK